MATHVGGYVGTYVTRVTIFLSSGQSRLVVDVCLASGCVFSQATTPQQVGTLGSEEKRLYGIIMRQNVIYCVYCDDGD